MLMKKMFTLFAAMTVLIFCFQNCSGTSQPVRFSEVLQKSPSSSNESDNGHGYDGKVYVLLGNNCHDGSTIHSKIVTKTAVEANLVRKDCQDISPVALNETQFQINPSNTDELSYLGEVFQAQVPMGGVVIDVSSAYLISGFGYSFVHSFGATADNDSNLNLSRLQLYEDGVAIGPAHSSHTDISNLGQGRYTHWFDGVQEYLRFSASDNSNPAINGKVYSFKILN